MEVGGSCGGARGGGLPGLFAVVELAGQVLGAPKCRSLRIHNHDSTVLQTFKEAAGKYLSGGQSQAPEAQEAEVQAPNPTGTGAAVPQGTKAQEGHASAGGVSGYLDKAKVAARDYLDKHPVKEGEPQTGFAGYLDQAKLKAKEYLDKDAQGAT